MFLHQLVWNFIKKKQNAQLLSSEPNGRIKYMITLQEMPPHQVNIQFFPFLQCLFLIIQFCVSNSYLYWNPPMIPWWPNLVDTTQPAFFDFLSSIETCDHLKLLLNFNGTRYVLEKEMATHSSVLAWRIPGMGEPGGLPSMGSHRVGHNWSDLAVSSSTYVQFLFFFYLVSYFMSPQRPVPQPWMWTRFSTVLSFLFSLFTRDYTYLYDFNTNSVWLCPR